MIAAKITEQMRRFDRIVKICLAGASSQEDGGSKLAS
jgi:hypothetical protein